ncbi:hypothetical protein AX17_002067 [Amanita inopinata Kibby_2008]|nr:hypothetical protein AX17_002067 [Amanita inopinata Kibby_2008]
MSLSEIHASANATSHAILTDVSSPVVDTPSCRLLGPTALVVQGLMGILVILSLVYKRHRERPVRPWRIWIFDISKQIVGQMFVHGLNVLISDVVSRLTSGNACVFYFLNILIDTTLGVAILYVIFHALTNLLSEKLRYEGFESGVYGDPPSVSYWLRQAAIYVLSLTTMKLLVIGLLILFPGLFSIGEWLLSWTWTEKGDGFQVIFTMGIFPIIMNILQFWFIDSIVKAHNKVGLDAETSDFQHADREPLFSVPSDDEDDHGYAHHDIENPSPSSHSRSLSFATDVSAGKSDMLDSIPVDQKSVETNFTQGRSDQHSYPPSLSSSLTSASSTSPKPAKNLLKLAKRRRNPPPNVYALSDSHPIHQPQPRIPQVASAAASLELEVRNSSTDHWSDSWDDSVDWTDHDTKDRTIQSWDSTATLRASS